MIIVLKDGADPGQVERLSEDLVEKGVKLYEIQGVSAKVIGVVGDTSLLSADVLMMNECVSKVLKVQEPYKLAGRRFNPESAVVDVNGAKIGGGEFAVMAGPCSVESEDQILSIAKDVKISGAKFLRGGAFKPRTSPYAFQGMGMEGLELLKMAREKTGLPIVTEIMSERHIDVFARDVDVIQVGARNMQNFNLLKAIGETGKTILLKRGLSSTINELLTAAEYALLRGESQVILCERGIRTFETATRNTLDLSAIPVLKEKSHLPVIADPSHGVGYWNYVSAMSLAAVAAGADGLIIEVHNCPDKALCDGAQSITPHLFEKLMKKIAKVREVITEE
ncbi:MAG: 3-deoxy-7-phosphoheptulonate synthase [Clostridiales bacterium]|nr:3-deoxy-7-phosphoheptulonate synthase [Clostridiales bacterium]